MLEDIALLWSELEYNNIDPLPLAGIVWDGKVETIEMNNVEIRKAIQDRDRDVFERYGLKDMIREYLDEEECPDPRLQGKLKFVAVYVMREGLEARRKFPLTQSMFIALFRKLFSRRPTRQDMERLTEGFYYTINKRKRGYKTFL